MSKHFLSWIATGVALVAMSAVVAVPAFSQGRGPAPPKATSAKPRGSTSASAPRASSRSASGIGASATLGILVGLVYAGAHLISFAVEPLTTKILCGWIAGGVIQFAVAGAIVGAIYKPASARTP